MSHFGFQNRHLNISSADDAKRRIRFIIKKTTTTNLISDSYQSKEPDHDHHLMCTPEEGKIQPFFWIPQLKQPVWAVKHISGHKSFDFRPIFRSYSVPIHGRNAYSKPVEAISRETILFTCRATIQATDYNITSFWVNVCLSCEQAHYMCVCTWNKWIASDSSTHLNLKQIVI